MTTKKLSQKIENISGFGTGRISEIISYLEKKNSTALSNISNKTKFDTLCMLLNCSKQELDKLISALKEALDVKTT